LILFTISLFSLTSCGWKPSEEDIKKLEETKSAALSAEKTLADKKKEVKDLEAKVAAKKKDLEKLKSDKDKVMQSVQAAK